MTHYWKRGIVAVCAAGLVALGAGVSTGASAPTPGLVVKVTLRGGGIGSSATRFGPGRTTLVIRNAGAVAQSFAIARHTGGVSSLPRFEGMPFVPAGEVVGRPVRIAPHSQKRLTLTLARGSYLLVASSTTVGSPILVDAAMHFAVG